MTYTGTDSIMVTELCFSLGLQILSYRYHNIRRAVSVASVRCDLSLNLGHTRTNVTLPGVDHALYWHTFREKINEQHR